MYNLSFFVITGGPGAGKTTLLNELENRRYKCVPEVAREIIKAQAESGGDALPWKDTTLYAQLMLERSVESYRLVSQDTGRAEITFFDRGIVDTLCYARLIGIGITGEMDRIARQFRYNKKVFMLPPWQEIYQTDTERKQTWEEAVLTFQTMVDTYGDYGYEIVEVPRLPVKERADFVTTQISFETKD